MAIARASAQSEGSGSRATLRSLVTAYAARILAVDAEVADLWGRLNTPDPLPAVDGLLAATAIVHDLTLVTKSTRDVQRIGVRLLDPFRD